MVGSITVLRSRKFMILMRRSGWGHLHLERLPDHFARDERQLGFFHSRSVEIALFFLTV